MGIIATIIGVLIVLNMPRLSHLGTTAGWSTFSLGAFIALVGASIKCIKKSQGRIAPKLINGKPLVVPTPIEVEEVPKEAVTQFRELKEGSTVWVGPEKKSITIGKCVGCGGSKRAMEIPEDQVLMLPNFGNGFYVWRRMVDEEVQISDRLTELGILTVQSKRVDIFLSADSDQPLPAYTCPSFNDLTKRDMHVIDSKNSESSCWKERSYFEGNEDRFSPESWLPIIKPLLQDMYTLARNNCLFGGDAFNIVIIESEQGYSARYFGFDFSSKAAVCDREYGLREDDVKEEIVQYLPPALEKVFAEQLDYDTGKKNIGLTEEYRRLIEEFQKKCPEILSEIENSQP
ncbi:MAG: hypothetical protein JJU12_05355 [Chlamydiales bacterium]|nr:hypothetical protein [Chlamydiales bacterium]